MQYGMVIDTRACMGCHTCAVKCKQANNLPAGIRWNKVHSEGGDGMDAMGGEFPNCSITFRPVACQHCGNPACVAACPTGATYKDDETGIVMQNYDECIGCQSCVKACPYEGVRSYLDGEPEWYLEGAQGGWGIATPIANTVSKCTLCHGRVEQGLEPACVHVCPGRARIFGDLDDPESEVAKLIAAGSAEQLNPEAGTSPSIYYLA